MFRTSEVADRLHQVGPVSRLRGHLQRLDEAGDSVGPQFKQILACLRRTVGAETDAKHARMMTYVTLGALAATAPEFW